MMKTIVINRILAGMLACASAMPMLAGGYLGNTNQSIAFLRNPARDAAIGTDGVYYNPAGTAFMTDGLHLQFNWQMVRQYRDSKSMYGDLFKYNFTNPSEDGSKTFSGRVNVPVQPSVFALYNRNGWSWHAGFGLIGGGGGCEYDDGLGSFEALIGSQALATLGEAFGGYSADCYVRGRSYDLGLTLGASRKINNKLSASLGLRGIYATNNYKGYLRNIRFRRNDGLIIDSSVNPALSDIELDCDQTGFGVAPILGVDYRPNRFLNIAAKYEFKTRLRLKNDANNNGQFDGLAASQPSLNAYTDGVETPADMPALLTLGVQVSPMESLRLMAGYHHYFDVDTRQWSKSSVSDTEELTLGAEYVVSRDLVISLGGQRTIYDQTDGNVSDLAFNLSSYSFGAGLAYRINPAVTINVAYFRTIYDDYTKTVPPQSVTTYSRTNNVLGVGLELNL